MRWTAVIAIALLAACQGEKQADTRGPEDFNFTAMIEPQGGAKLQRIEVPAAALVAIKRWDFGDIRVFDGRGKALPIAQLDRSERDRPQRHDVPTYPIASSAAAPAGPAVSIEVARPGQTISIATGDMVNRESTAILIDTRALSEPAVELWLDATLPPNQLIDCTVESSGDLKSWEHVTDQVLFSPGPSRPMPDRWQRIELAGVDLRKRYLRVRWKADPGVAMGAATVVTSKTVPPQRIALATRGVQLDNSHNLRFAGRPIARFAAIRLTASTVDGFVPFRLYGRGADEQPWILLGSAKVRLDGRAESLELHDAHFTQYRIEADERSSGFSEVPKIELEVEPLTLLAAFNGQPPYRFAAGNDRAENKMFAPSDLAEPKMLEAELPLAKVEAAAAPIIALDAGAADGSFTPGKLVLWGALLLGTGVLAFGAIRLLRANAVP